jgi:WD40 repeat protein
MRSAANLLMILALLACPEVVRAEQLREVRAPDAVILATVENDCTVVLRDAISGNAIATLYEPSDACRGATSQMPPSPWISLSPDGRLLATDRGYGPLDLWRLRGLRKVASLHAGHIDSLEFLLDSTVILVVATEAGKLAHRNEIRIWEIATQKQLFYARESYAMQFKKAALSPDGKMIFAVVGPSGRGWVNERYRMNRIKLWDIEDPKEPVIFKGESAEFSPDGKYLAVTDSGRQMLWDIRAGEMISAEQPSSWGAQAITADNVAESIGNNKWNWTAFIKGDRQSIGEIKCVEYTLHPTFPDPVRLVCEPGDPQRPFGLSATGWGTFSIGIRVFMKNGTHEDLRHQLKF